jgi:hypothetical protein
MFDLGGEKISMLWRPSMQSKLVNAMHNLGTKLIIESVVSIIQPIESRNESAHGWPACLQNLSHPFDPTPHNPLGET